MENFEFDPDEKILALTEKGNTQIKDLAALAESDSPSLDYHHFRVADMFFPDKDQIISLDREQNLAWGEITSRRKGSPGRNDADSFGGEAKAFPDLQRIRSLLYTTANPDRAMILDRNGKLYQSLSLSSPGAVAVSPTGRYIMTADENNRVELYQSVLHQSPEDYLKNFACIAEETARRFQNQLSDIPASSKAFDWNNENKTLKILEESLKVAESTEQWSEAEGLAQEILILDPKNRLAEATLKIERQQRRIDFGKRLNAFGRETVCGSDSFIQKKSVRKAHYILKREI